MYDNINTNSIIDVAKAVIDLIFSQFMPMERLELFVEYIVIPFFIYIVMGLVFLKIIGKINFRNFIRLTISSLLLALSLLWVLLTWSMDASFIVILAPTIPIIIIWGIKKLIMLCRRIKHQPKEIKA
jgi:hypothetical protein